jgi:hypothetical protein
VWHHRINISQNVPLGRPSPFAGAGPFGRPSALGAGGPFGRPSALGAGGPFGRPSALGAGGPFGRPSALGAGGPFGKLSPLAPGGPGGVGVPLQETYQHAKWVVIRDGRGTYALVGGAWAATIALYNILVITSLGEPLNLPDCSKDEQRKLHDCKFGELRSEITLWMMAG